MYTTAPFTPSRAYGHDRHGEPGPRRFHRKDKDGIASRPQDGVRAVPAPLGTQGTGGGHPLRRRAADAGHGPGADEPSAAPAARRAVDGTRAAADPRDFQHHRGHQQERHDGPARRAEREHGALHRKSRLCPRDGAHHALRRRKRARRQRGYYILQNNYLDSIFIILSIYYNIWNK